MDRRGFISAIVRGGILIGITTTSGYLLARKGDESKGIGCNSICNGCKTLPICTKPEAIQVKRAGVK